MALWEVDPWGPERDDLRAAVQSAWNRGADMETLQIQFPYREAKDAKETEADEDEIVALLEQEAEEAERNGSRT